MKIWVIRWARAKSAMARGTSLALTMCVSMRRLRAKLRCRSTASRVGFVGPAHVDGQAIGL